jgi:CrcB protein
VSTALAVAMISGLAAVARVTAARHLGGGAYAILRLNLAGALVLGVLTGAGVTGDGLLLAGTAFLGSFTTFSTWMLDEDLLLEEGLPGAAAHLLALGTFGGAAMAAVGWALGSLT